MGKIKKIIVAVDGSVDGCKAVDRAIELAKKVEHIWILFMFQVISIRIFPVI